MTTNQEALHRDINEFCARKTIFFQNLDKGEFDQVECERLIARAEELSLPASQRQLEQYLEHYGRV